MSPELQGFFDDLAEIQVASHSPAEAVEPAKDAFIRFVQKCGIEYCNFGSFDVTADGVEMAALSGTNMSDEWIEEYMGEEFYRDDYVIRRVKALTPARPFATLRFGEWTVGRLAENEQESAKVLRGCADAGMEDAFGFVGLVPLGAGRHDRRYFVFGLGGEQGTGQHAAEQAAELQIAAQALLDRLRPELEAALDGVTPQLSNRERDVLAHIAAGKDRTMIAFRLGISLPTVDLHLAGARRKLNAATTAQAVARACRYGLL